MVPGGYKDFTWDDLEMVVHRRDARIHDLEAEVEVLREKVHGLRYLEALGGACVFGSPGDQVVALGEHNWVVRQRDSRILELERENADLRAAAYGKDHPKMASDVKAGEAVYLISQTKLDEYGKLEQEIKQAHKYHADVTLAMEGQLKTVKAERDDWRRLHGIEARRCDDKDKYVSDVRRELADLRERLGRVKDLATLPYTPVAPSKIEDVTRRVNEAIERSCMVPWSIWAPRKPLPKIDASVESMERQPDYWSFREWWKQNEKRFENSNFPRHVARETWIAACKRQEKRKRGNK
jgi:hypothetical protein